MLLAEFIRDLAALLEKHSVVVDAGAVFREVDGGWRMTTTADQDGPAFVTTAIELELQLQLRRLSPQAKP